MTVYTPAENLTCGGLETLYDRPSKGGRVSKTASSVVDKDADRLKSVGERFDEILANLAGPPGPWPAIDSDRQDHNVRGENALRGLRRSYGLPERMRPLQGSENRQVVWSDRGEGSPSSGGKDLKRLKRNLGGADAR